MSESKHSSAPESRTRWDRAKYGLYFGEKIARIGAAIAPFVFFGILLVKTYQQFLAWVHVSSAVAVGPCDAQGHALRSAAEVAQEAASRGTELFVLPFVSITILLLASMALIARAIQRD